MVRRGPTGTYSYDKTKRLDRSGRRWHFVHHQLPTDIAEYTERPYELLFRDEERTVFGRIRFDHLKDNPYRDYETLVTKIMNDSKFRRSLLDPSSADLWQRSWK
jgi:hypothetical protein